MKKVLISLCCNLLVASIIFAHTGNPPNIFNKGRTTKVAVPYIRFSSWLQFNRIKNSKGFDSAGALTIKDIMSGENSYPYDLPATALCFEATGTEGNTPGLTPQYVLQGGYTQFRQSTNHSFNLDVYNSGTSIPALTALQNGYIGIGTSSPGSKLDVNGRTKALDFEAAGTEGNTPGLNPQYILQGGYTQFRQSTNHSFNLDVYNSGTSIAALTALQNGDIGIGTSSPGSKLDVNGRTKALDFEATGTEGNYPGLTPQYILQGGYTQFRQSTNHSLNIDVYNSGASIAAFTALQNGYVGVGN
jgi:hypothetical protein